MGTGHHGIPVLPRGAPQALCVWVAASGGESRVLRPRSCSKTKTISKIWAFPKGQVLPEQLSVSPAGPCGVGPSAVHPGGQQWATAMGCTGGSGSQELLTGLSCILPWVKKCNGVANGDTSAEVPLGGASVV